MKKGFLALAAGILALVLAACDESAEPTKDSSKENESDMSAEDVYTKALEKSEEMESADVTMDVNQKIDPEGDEGTMETDSKFDMQMTMDPFAAYMDGTTSIKMGGDEDDEGMMPDMDTDIEMYMVDDGMYLNNEEIGKWMKMDNASTDMIEEMGGQQPDPSEQLEVLKDYADDLSFEQSDDEFILKMDAEGEDSNAFVQDMIKENLSDEMLEQMEDEEQEALENMDINGMSLELGVDKETFEMTTYNLDMDMTMEVEDEKMNLAQTMEAEYSNFNNVDPIEVPDEVKDEAIDEDEAMEEAMEEQEDLDLDEDMDEEELEDELKDEIEE